MKKNIKQVFHKAFIMVMTMVIAVSSSLYLNSSVPILADEITDLESQIKALETQNKKNAADLKNIQGQQDSVLEQRAVIADQISNTNQQIALFKKKIISMENSIATKEIEIGEKSNEIEESRELFAQRVRAMYIANSTSTLNTLLSSKSLGDFLAKSEILKRISQSDDELIDSLNEENVELNKAKADMEEQNKQLKQTKSEFDAKSADLAKLKKQNEVNEQALKEKEKAVALNMQKNAKLIKANEAEIDRILIERANNGSGGPEGAFKWPLPGHSRLTSKFGYRTDPFTGKQDFHLGIDIPAPRGTNILSANDGEVILVKNNEYGYGHHIVIDHGGGYATLYGHTSRIDVNVGDKVKRGQVIGGVGSTGASTGNHLHFEVRVIGKQVQPLDYVKIPT